MGRRKINRDHKLILQAIARRRKRRFDSGKLYDVAPKAWKFQWKYHAKIEEPYSLEKLSAYMAKHIRRKNYDEIDVGFYDSKLLNKLELPDYMVNF